MSKKKKSPGHTLPEPGDVTTPAAEAERAGEVIDEVKVIIESGGLNGGPAIETTIAGLKDAAASFTPSTEWNTPDALAKYDFETQQRVTTQADEVGDAERDYESAKTAASDAKKELETMEKRLRLLIRERADRRGKKPVGEEPNLFAGATGEPMPADDHWRLFPIERLHDYGLPKTIIEKLATGEMKKGADGIGPITTMGAMSRYSEPSASGWTRQLTDLKGIGAEAAEKWRDASDKFWEAWKTGLADKFAEEQGLTRVEPAKEVATEPETKAA